MTNTHIDNTQLFFFYVFISTAYNNLCISKDIKQFNLQLLFFSSP